jgi:hypothetical protein
LCAHFDCSLHVLFSFLQTLQDAFAGGQQKIPGLFVIFDLSPFMVKVSVKRMPLSTFLTSVFAIVGGVFTIAGVIASILDYSTQNIVKIHASPRTGKGN